MKLTFMFTFVGCSSAIAISSAKSTATAAANAAPTTQIVCLKSLAHHRKMLVQAVKENDACNATKWLNKLVPELQKLLAHRKTMLMQAVKDNDLCHVTKWLNAAFRIRNELLHYNIKSTVVDASLRMSGMLYTNWKCSYASFGDVHTLHLEMLLDL